MEFPLYDTLLSLGSINQKVEPGFISNVIANLDGEEKEVMYALILHHYQLSTGKLTKYSIPYEGITFQQGTGVLFNINRLPIKLLNVLGHYALFVLGRGETSSIDDYTEVSPRRSSENERRVRRLRR